MPFKVSAKSQAEKCPRPGLRLGARTEETPPLTEEQIAVLNPLARCWRKALLHPDKMASRDWTWNAVPGSDFRSVSALPLVEMDLERASRTAWELAIKSMRDWLTRHTLAGNAPGSLITRVFLKAHMWQTTPERTRRRRSPQGRPENIPVQAHARGYGGG